METVRAASAPKKFEKKHGGDGGLWLVGRERLDRDTRGRGGEGPAKKKNKKNQEKNFVGRKNGSNLPWIGTSTRRV